MKIETENVILRIGLNGELLGQFNNVKHAAKIISGHFQCVYRAIWEKKLYKESFWQYGFVKKEIETITYEENTKQETLCLRCRCKFLTRNKKINHICPKCNIINDNLWDNNTIYKVHQNI